MIDPEWWMRYTDGSESTDLHNHQSEKIYSRDTLIVPVNFKVLDIESSYRVAVLMVEPTLNENATTRIPVREIRIGNPCSGIDSGQIIRAHLHRYEVRKDGLTIARGNKTFHKLQYVDRDWKSTEWASLIEKLFLSNEGQHTSIHKYSGRVRDKPVIW